MAISEAKKRRIIADYKTGAYSFNKLAKKHKISVNTVRKNCTDVNHDNAPLVKALYEVENLKKCTKNEQELKAVENVVKNRLKVQDLSHKLMDKIEQSINKDKAQKVVVVGSGNGCSNPEIVEYDYQPEHYEKLANSLHKTAQTLGTIETKSNVEINNTNQQATNNIIEII